MSKYNDYPKEQTGGGGRRFIFLLLAIALLAFMVAAWTGGVVTENHGGVGEIVTTATPTPPAGVAVNVSQSQAAPNVSITMQQPAAPPSDDYAVQLAFIEAARAYQRGDEAYRKAERVADELYPRVAAIETRIATPPTPAVELELLQFDTTTHRYTLNILTVGFFALLGLVVALAVWVAYLNRPHPPTPTNQPQPTPPTPPTPPETTTQPLHGANTVQHGAGTVQPNGAGATHYLWWSGGGFLRPLTCAAAPCLCPRSWMS
jgi:hypothetical protein